MSVDKNFINSSRGKFELYCDEVKVNFCPFLSPAKKEGLIYFESIPIHVKNKYFLQSEFFWLMVKSIEKFCLMRNELTRDKKKLLCFNIEFTYPQEFSTSYGKRRFEVPYWILRKIFTPNCVMIGDFWLGEHEISCDGRMLPEPRLNFFSIRSAINNLDDRFIDSAPELLSDYKKCFLNINDKQSNNNVLKNRNCHLSTFKNRLKEYNKIKYEVYHV